MANFYGTTASSGAKIKNGKEKELKEFLDKYSTSGEDGDLVKIEDGHIHIYGYDFFNVYKKITDVDLTEDDDPSMVGEPDYDGDYYNEFFKGLAKFLAEPLIIHSVGNEKCRFPLSAWEIAINPDGRVKTGGFKWWTTDEIWKKKKKKRKK